MKNKRSIVLIISCKHLSLINDFTHQLYEKLLYNVKVKISFSRIVLTYHLSTHISRRFLTIDLSVSFRKIFIALRKDVFIFILIFLTIY